MISLLLGSGGGESGAGSVVFQTLKPGTRDLVQVLGIRVSG